MSEQVITAALAPVEAAALEELHQLASAEIERLEKTVPPRLAAAEQTVQDWAHDAINTLHRFVARIDQHRQRASTTPADAPAPAVPPKAVGGPVPNAATPVIVGDGTPETVVPVAAPTEAAK